MLNIDATSKSFLILLFVWIIHKKCFNHYIILHFLPERYSLLDPTKLSATPTTVPRSKDTSKSGMFIVRELLLWSFKCRHSKLVSPLNSKWRLQLARVWNSTIVTKGGFFSESAICFFKSPNLQKKIFQKTTLSLKFKFLVQDSFLEYIFLEIWRFEKHIALSEKSHLYSTLKVR